MLSLNKVIIFSEFIEVLYGVFNSGCLCTDIVLVHYKLLTYDRQSLMRSVEEKYT
jgi:hypothetical protein